MNEQSETLDFMESLRIVVEMARRCGAYWYETEDPEQWGDEDLAPERREAFLAIERLSKVQVDPYTVDYTGRPDGWRTDEMGPETWLYSEIDVTEHHEDENGVAWCRFTDFDRQWCCEHGLTEEMTEQRALCELSAAFECRKRNSL